MHHKQVHYLTTVRVYAYASAIVLGSFCCCVNTNKCIRTLRSSEYTNRSSRQRRVFIRRNGNEKRDVAPRAPACARHIDVRDCAIGHKGNSSYGVHTYTHTSSVRVRFTVAIIVGSRGTGAGSGNGTRKRTVFAWEERLVRQHLGEDAPEEKKADTCAMEIMRGEEKRRGGERERARHGVA